MGGRMIHSVDGKLGSIPYGLPHQAILSIDRRALNETLLTGLIAMSTLSIKLSFECQGGLYQGVL